MRSARAVPCPAARRNGGWRRCLSWLVVAVLASVLAPVALHGAPQPQAPDTTRLIYLLHANTLTYDKREDADRQVLTGDVRFRQDSAYMYCDKAYFYRSTNSMEAFGHVRMEQGDSLYLFCDTLAYDGNTLMAHCTDNVRLFHNRTILYSDYLVYNRLSAEAHYPETGVIVDSTSHLYSQLGWYYPNERRAFFQYDVQLRGYDYSDGHPDSGRVYAERYPTLLDSLLDRREPPHHAFCPDDRELKPAVILYSDTLTYRFDQGRAQVLGPSRIVNDTATVLTTHGIYDMHATRATLLDRSRVLSPGRMATGDRMTYDFTVGVGEGWGDVLMYDTVQQMSLAGDYLHFVNEPRRATVTGRALAKEFSDRDTLYLHADTLRAYTLTDSVVHRVRRDTLMRLELDSTLRVWHDSLAVDSMGRDSLVAYAVDSLVSYWVDTLMQVMVDSAAVDTFHYMTAHFNVRYFREDMQGICDSLNYNVHDSLATFVGNPVMWNGLYQITGDTIFAIVAQGGILRAMVHDNAFLVQQKDTIHYDQISGKELVCYFDSSRLERMDMSGNVQIIFYPEESDHTLIGLNQVVGNYLSIWFRQNKMDHLTIWPQPVGSLTPIPLVTEDILYLERFRWMDYLRPTDAQDVFRDVRMKAEDVQEAVRLFDDNELNGY